MRERLDDRGREGLSINPEPGSFCTLSASNTLDLFSSSPWFFRVHNKEGVSVSDSCRPHFISNIVQVSSEKSNAKVG